MGEFVTPKNSKASKKSSAVYLGDCTKLVLIGKENE